MAKSKRGNKNKNSDAVKKINVNPKTTGKKKERHKWRDARTTKKVKLMNRSTEAASFLPAHPRKSVLDKDKEEGGSLRDRMMKRLDAARFRQLNETLDSSSSTSNPVSAFQSDPEMFRKYHDAYKKQVENWPQNPLDIIVKWVKRKLKGGKVIADFGCGEAKLAESVPNKVHSFDLFALNERVTACDMSRVPLEDETVDAVVFCLSLMGTDVSRFIVEANRVLKVNGLLKIAEVSSRFSGPVYLAFVKRMKRFGFIFVGKKQPKSKPKPRPESDDNDAISTVNKNQIMEKCLEEDGVFLMLEFRKIKTAQNTDLKKPGGRAGKLPALKLNPSVYKKR